MAVDPNEVIWSWSVLKRRGWTTALYYRLLGRPDQTPRGKHTSQKGRWAVTKSRVLAAEAKPTFKEAVKEERTRRKSRMQKIEERLAKTEGFEYVVLTRRSEENPRTMLNNLLGQKNWQRTTLWPWVEQQRNGGERFTAYLIRDDLSMTAFRLSPLNDEMMWFLPVDEAKQQVRDREKLRTA